MINSLLNGSVELLLDNQVILDICPHQLFFVNNQVKFFLPRTARIGNTQRDTQRDTQEGILFQTSQHSYQFNPLYRLWSWEPSEYDTVCSIGSIIQYHTKQIQHLFNIFKERPQLATFETNTSLLMQLVNKQMKTPCVFDNTCFTSALYTITQEMMYSFFYKYFS